MIKNELLEELWEIKDEIGKENKYDFSKLIIQLRKNQNKRKIKVVDFSKKLKPVKL